VSLVLSVLLVEDNELNRILIRDVLQRRGHEVTEASDIPEGLACLRTHRPDVVLLDIDLKGESGELLLKEIRRAPQWTQLPVLAVTAFAMPGDRERLLGAGFDDYFTKPINVRSFVPDVEAAVLRLRTRGRA
jgi:two-component system cell cycle response regulator DivK